MSKPRIVIHETRQKAFREAWAGDSITMEDLCQAFALAPATARRIAKEMGLGPKGGLKGEKWPPEHDAMLKELHAQGVSYSIIADRLNVRFRTRYERGAISGRANRLGLAKRKLAPQALRVRTGDVKKAGNPHLMRKPKQPEGVFVLAPANRTAEPAPPRVIVGANAFDPIPGVQPVAFLEREGARCRWPVELDDGQHWCCGAPTADAAVSYCVTHGRLGTNQSEWAKRHKAQMSPRGLRRYAA